jgi:hypothetical protein
MFIRIKLFFRYEKFETYTPCFPHGVIGRSFSMLLLCEEYRGGAAAPAPLELLVSNVVKP